MGENGAGGRSAAPACFVSRRPSDPFRATQEKSISDMGSGASDSSDSRRFQRSCSTPLAPLVAVHLLPAKKGIRAALENFHHAVAGRGSVDGATVLGLPYVILAVHRQYEF